MNPFQRADGMICSASERRAVVKDTKSSIDLFAVITMKDVQVSVRDAALRSLVKFYHFTPCPFCGSESIKISYIPDATPELLDPIWSIGCGSKKCTVFPVACENNFGAALLNWNKRVASTVTK